MDPRKEYLFCPCKAWLFPQNHNTVTKQQQIDNNKISSSLRDYTWSFKHFGLFLSIITCGNKYVKVVGVSRYSGKPVLLSIRGTKLVNFLLYFYSLTVS